jgi:peptide/nickel transport system permease protein
MTETVLSYLGLGITDPAVSWGSLIKRDLSTLANLRAFPWLLDPVWFLLAVTLAFNFIGDALRDYFDPYHIQTVKRPSDWILSLFRKAGSRNEKPAFSPALSANSGDNAAFLLEINNLAVDFSIQRGREFARVPAVRGVSFSLAMGECLGIVGESGSGKSVSTLAIPGLLPKSAAISGSIRDRGIELAGLDAKALREYRGKKIGMIFQEPGRSYDPLQNMGSVFLETFRNSDPAITAEEANRRAVALLEETGLDNGRERLSTFPHQFSGGQWQRIGIALALAQGCELLIADEPTTALDLTIQKQIVELLKTLRRTRNISIIFISHDIDLVAEISNRIMVMYGGLIMESGTSKDITKNPRHPYTTALLAASPRFGSHYSKERLLTIPGKVSDPASLLREGCPFAGRCVKAAPECKQAVPPLQTFANNNGQAREIRCTIN